MTVSRKGKFSMVSRSIWRSERFGKVDVQAHRLAYFYFLTCDHTNGVGCFRLPDGYAVADLGENWTLDLYRAARADLVRVELIDFDEATGEVMVERWLRNNPPTNQKHASSLRAAIYAIDSDRLREKVEADFSEVWQPNPIDGGNNFSGSRLTGTSYIQGRGP